MSKSKAKTVREYLSALSPERRKVASEVLSLVRTNLPKGYKEELGWGAITWVVPLARFEDTYNGQPLCYVAFAATKAGFSLYLMGVYGDTKTSNAFVRAWKKSGKKLDMGKSCVRFRNSDDLALDAVKGAIKALPLKKYVEQYAAIRKKTKAGK